MFVPKSKAKKISNSKQCIVWEYQFPSELFSFCTATINGRYPPQGRVANLKCEETYFVVSGTGIVHSEKGDFKIKKDALYFFRAGEKYWVEGRKLKLILVNAPPWYPEQHKIMK